MHLLQSAVRRPRRTANKTQKDEHYIRSDDKRHWEASLTWKGGSEAEAFSQQTCVSERKETEADLCSLCQQQQPALDQGVVLNPEVIYSVYERKYCIPGCAVTINKVNEKTNSCLGDEGLEGEVGCMSGKQYKQLFRSQDFCNIWVNISCFSKSYFWGWVELNWNLLHKFRCLKVLVIRLQVTSEIKWSVSSGNQIVSFFFFFSKLN